MLTTPVSSGISSLETRGLYFSGKSLVGGRKALENRRFIKHLISEQESTGFKRDLGTAISRILGESKRLEDNSRGKRNVISRQTQETKYSLAESILRAKVSGF